MKRKTILVIVLISVVLGSFIVGIGISKYGDRINLAMASENNDLVIEMSLEKIQPLRESQAWMYFSFGDKSAPRFMLSMLNAGKYPWQLKKMYRIRLREYGPTGGWTIVSVHVPEGKERKWIESLDYFRNKLGRKTS